MKMRKTILTIVLIAVMVFSFSACVKDETRGQYELTPTYVSKAYIERGDESIPVMVRGYISIECQVGDQYKMLIDQVLRTVPEQGLDADTVISDKIQFNDIYFEEIGETDKVGIVYVDFKGGETQEGEAPMLSGGGSLEEALLISQIVESLVNSYAEVEQVQFLIDGQVVESLMGHFDAMTPYTEGIHTLVVDSN